MLCFVFWDAYVGILQDALDTDGYFCLSFKQPRASGMCWLAPSTQLILRSLTTVQYKHLELFRFSSHSRVVHVGIINHCPCLYVVKILHSECISVILKKILLSALCYHDLQDESLVSCHPPDKKEKYRGFRWCLFLNKSSHRLNTLAWNGWRNRL